VVAIDRTRITLWLECEDLEVEVHADSFPDLKVFVLEPQMTTISAARETACPDQIVKSGNFHPYFKGLIWI